MTKALSSDQIIEFTGTDNRPVFVNPYAIAAVSHAVQKTIIHLMGGGKLEVNVTEQKVAEEWKRVLNTASSP
jgi:hypothetical protein